MSDKSKIEWTDSTWNPLRARNRATGGVGHFCVHASEGCRNSYAERQQPRFRNRIRFAAQDRDKVELFLDDKVLMQPLHWRKPRMVFVCSMTDLFGEWVPDEHIDRVFAIMALSPQHAFQVLTKRAKRMREYLSRPSVAKSWWNAAFRLAQTGKIRIPDDHYADGETVPLPNVWFGVSAEDQVNADEGIPELLATPAAVRFVSYEPALGPVDFRPWLHDSDCAIVAEMVCTCSEPREYCLNWIIGGGESGPHARSADVDWFRSARDQCQAAGVAFFMKQLSGPGGRAIKDIEQFPADLRIREFPR